MAEFAKIKGLLVAPFTPYKDAAAEEINTEIIPAYARMLHDNGLKGVFINGSSGEGYMLTKEGAHPSRRGVAQRDRVGRLPSHRPRRLHLY